MIAYNQYVDDNVVDIVDVVVVVVVVCSFWLSIVDAFVSPNSEYYAHGR